MGVIINFIVFSIFSTLISAKEFVPVLLWGTRKISDPDDGFSGLSRLSTDEFSDYLLKKVQVEKSIIFLFMDENISVEDFSWRDVDENGAFPHLSNITKVAPGVTYFQSVHNPYNAIKKLQKHQWSWELYNDDASSLGKDKTIWLVKLKEPDYMENRPEMLKTHDKQMSKIYKKAVHSGVDADIFAIYTGHRNSWIDADIEYNRVKREDAEPSEPNSDLLILQDDKSTVLMALSKPIFFEHNGESENITEVSGTPTIQKNDTNIGFDINFKSNTIGKPKLEIDFYFDASETGSWVLTHASPLENKSSILVPDTPIYGPVGWSYYCEKSIKFKNQDTSFTVSNLQVQPYVKDGRFGPPVDCVPYFSSAIWSGIFVVFILGIVSAWGILMIMDINTMDRFDDPKGKTITITATD